MRRYSVVGSQHIPGAVAGGFAEADAGVVAVLASESVQPRIHFVSISFQASAADAQYGFAMKRMTTAGTWTAVTPAELSLSGLAAITAGRSNSTAAPTVTGTELLKIGLHARSGFEWFEDPERGMVATAAANNGIALYVDFSSGSSPQAVATLHFSE
jgi:hypothetical protein